MFTFRRWCRSQREPTATLLAGLLWLIAPIAGCSHLYYHPSDIQYAPQPELLDKIRTEVTLTSGDDTRLAAWWIPARAGEHRGVVVQFHGNAENMTSHFASLLWLTEQGYDLLAFDYRGFGISDGEPSPHGLNLDALAAMRYAFSRIEGKSLDLIFYGQSIGGAVMLRAFDDLKTEERELVRALVVESSFHSYPAIGRDILSRSWLTTLLQPLAYLLISNAYGPTDAIPRIAPTPLLVLHGDRDPVVPISFGREIFALARDPKRFYLIPEGGHLTASPEATAQMHHEILTFIHPRATAR